MTRRRDAFLVPLQERRRELERLLAKVDRELAALPEGQLRFSTISGKTRYYLANGRAKGKDRYLGEAQRDYVKKLARRRYLSELKASAEQELQAILVFMEALPAVAPEDVHAESRRELRELTPPLVLSDEQFREAWLAEMQEGATGERLRSRIERIIWDAIGRAGLAAVYEPGLYLEGYGRARPDFAILDPRTRKTVYYEHFGMMDDEKYRHHNLPKIAAYHNNGFFDGVNFLMTMEGSETPLDLDEAGKLIAAFFGKK